MPKFTQKHYQVIQDIIHRSGFIQDQKRQQARESMRRLIASDFIGTLKHDNPRFNSEKFLIACGITK